MIKPFLILLLGSFGGNKLMVQNASYGFELGAQRGSFRLGLDISYIATETKEDSFHRGQNTLIPIMASFTINPQIHSNLKPYVGIGIGHVEAMRDITSTAIPLWREWETIGSGTGYEFKGGLEYRASRNIYMVAGVKQLFFETKLTEHRQQSPQFESSLDYQRVRDVNLNALIGNLGVKVVF